MKPKSLLALWGAWCTVGMCATRISILSSAACSRAPVACPCSCRRRPSLSLSLSTYLVTYSRPPASAPTLSLLLRRLGFGVELLGVTLKALDDDSDNCQKCHQHTPTPTRDNNKYCTTPFSLQRPIHGALLNKLTRTQPYRLAHPLSRTKDARPRGPRPRHGQGAPHCAQHHHSPTLRRLLQFHDICIAACPLHRTAPQEYSIICIPAHCMFAVAPPSHAPCYSALLHSATQTTAVADSSFCCSLPSPNHAAHRPFTPGMPR